MRGLNELMGDLKLPKNVKSHLENHRIWSHWKEIVGPELYRVTSPYEIRGQSLVILVAHQAWAQQLHFLKTSILGKIRTRCAETRLSDLQFRVGQIEKHRQAPKQEAVVNESGDLKEIKLSERQEMTLRAVEDPQLREKIRQAMQAEAFHQKSR